MNRCQCPKPTFASIGIKKLLNGEYDNFGYHLDPNDCLHFKKATPGLECGRCGKPLCRDCAIDYTSIKDLGFIVSMSREILCHNCKDIKEELEKTLDISNGI